MNVRGLVPLLAASVIGGCGGGTTDSTLGAQLAGRSFVSESVEGHQLVAGTQVDVSFGSFATGTNAQMIVGAQAGCSSFYGPYEIESSTLRVSMLEMMDPGCGDPAQAQDWLSAFLLAGPILELDDPRLVMRTTDTRIDLLDRKLALPDRPLVGTQWLGTGFSDGMVITSTPGSSNVTLSFGSDGHVVVNTSCQTGTGSFTVNAATVTFDALTYDGTPCADPTFQEASDQTKLVLDGSPVTYTISETTLFVTHGKNALVFSAAP